MRVFNRRLIVVEMVALAGALTLAALPKPAHSAPGLVFTATSVLDTPDVVPGNSLCADSNGLCTLRAAVMEANAHAGPDTIVLLGDLYALSRSGTDNNAINGDLDLAGTLVISGAGAALTTVSGGTAGDRVFHVQPGANVTLKGITVRDGNAQIGAGIYNSGTLLLLNSLVDQNTASSNGGGIYSAGSLTIQNSTIQHNRATDGAGIYNVSMGALTLTASTLYSNTALDDGAALYLDSGSPAAHVLSTAIRENVASGGYGGALYALSGITLTASDLSGNRTGQFAGGAYIGPAAVALIHSSVISGNQTGFEGGGVLNDGYTTLLATTVITNSALAGGAASNNGRLLVQQSVISNNLAVRGGGLVSHQGRITVSLSTIANNRSLQDGGGIGIYSATVTVLSSTIDGNTALGLGGGLWTQPQGTAHFSQSTISGNSANSGGGISIQTGTVRLVNTTVSGNSAKGNGGGVDQAGGLLDVFNATIANNTANSDGLSGGVGGGIQRTTGNAFLRNSILALNRHMVAALGLADDCVGQLDFVYYSLVGKTTNCVFVNDHSLADVNANLLPLADNGGPTRTRALMRSSPAIDAGNPAGCIDHTVAVLAVDQRGRHRPTDGDGDGNPRCDMGAYEYPATQFLPLILR